MRFARQVNRLSHVVHLNGRTLPSSPQYHPSSAFIAEFSATTHKAYTFYGLSSLTILGLGLNFVFCVFHITFFSVKVKFFVPLLWVYVCIMPGKAVTKMTYTVSGGTLNPTHSL